MCKDQKSKHIDHYKITCELHVISLRPKIKGEDFSQLKHNHPSIQWPPCRTVKPMNQNPKWFSLDKIKTENRNLFREVGPCTTLILPFRIHKWFGKVKLSWVWGLRKRRRPPSTILTISHEVERSTEGYIMLSLQSVPKLLTNLRLKHRREKLWGRKTLKEEELRVKETVQVSNRRLRSPVLLSSKKQNRNRTSKHSLLPPGFFFVYLYLESVTLRGQCVRFKGDERRTGHGGLSRKYKKSQIPTIVVFPIKLWSIWW